MNPDQAAANAFPPPPTPPEDDALYSAALSFLSNRHTILYADWDLTRNKDKAARWLADQIRGVAEHFTASASAPPFFPAGPLTEPPAAPYAGPYSTETRGSFNPYSVLEEELRRNPDYLTTARTEAKP